MRINAWYQLPDGDNEGRIWHAADIGEWSLTVGGAGCRSVVDSYRGPWWVHFAPSELDMIEDGPFKTLASAKRAGVRMAKEHMGEMMKALEGMK